MMKKRSLPLREAAVVIRSKNAGPYELTLDIIFKRRKDYIRVKKLNFFTAGLIAGLYRVPPETVKDIIYFDPASAVKINIRRAAVSGGAGDTDVYGAQQHAPLLKIRIPL